MLNKNMIMTGSYVILQDTLYNVEGIREDARKRPGETVLRMTWKV